MAVLKINGITMPTPKEFTPKRSDLSSSETGRTQNQLKMKKDVARIITTLSCAWSALSWSDCSKLLSAVEDDGAEFDVTYPDPKVGAYVTKKFYVGDRTAPAYSLVGGQEMWEGVSFDFIEV